MFGFVLIKEIEIADILTFLTIIVSIVALLKVWLKEIRIRKKEKADKIRTAAAKTVAKLERWKELSLWFYKDIQPLFVETSEMLKVKYDVDEARDFLWKKLHIARKDTTQRILDEEIEIAYVELYGYYPEIYDKFTNLIKKLKDLEETTFWSFLDMTQDDFKELKSHPEHDYDPVTLGNDLRVSCDKKLESFQNKIETEIEQINNILYNLILKSDEDILKKDSSL